MDAIFEDLYLDSLRWRSWNTLLTRFTMYRFVGIAYSGDAERGLSTYDIVVSPASTLHRTDVLIGGYSSA